MQTSLCKTTVPTPKPTAHDTSRGQARPLSRVRSRVLGLLLRPAISPTISPTIGLAIALAIPLAIGLMLLQPPAALAQDRAAASSPAAPAAARPAPTPLAPSASAAEQLAALLNEQRVARGLAPVPLSRSLNAVAEAHVRDLQAHPRASGCNMHSWSPNGQWSACCYTDDHARASCMWRKPAEITGGAYRGEGFEISSWFSSRITPERALDSWRGSAAHFEVVINSGMWASSTWRAMGVALSENYAVVWFGTMADPQR